jgi:hypothetical protein
METAFADGRELAGHVERTDARPGAHSAALVDPLYRALHELGSMTSRFTLSDLAFT